MKKLFHDVWRRDKKGFLIILLLNIVLSMTGGISVVMLIPLLGLLQISEDSVSALAALAAPLHRFSYPVQVCILIAAYFLLVVGKALLGRLLSVREYAFVEDYSCGLRSQLYRAVSRADWETLSAERQVDTVDLFAMQCGEVGCGAAEVIHLVSSLLSAAVQLAAALWLSLPVTVFVFLCGCVYIFAFRGLFRTSREYGEKMIRLNRSMYEELFNQLRGVKEVRSYNVQHEHAVLFEQISNSFRSARMTYVRQRAVPQVICSCAAAFMIGLIFLVCVLVFRMDAARLMILLYVFMRLWPVFSGLYSRLQSIQSAAPALDKLDEAFACLTQEETRPNGAEPLEFEREIRFENVSFAYRGSEEEMIAALKKAQAWAFVSGLKEGLDTAIGDDGVRLSGGERQRLVMARVLLGHPQLIVMDEATSAMDYESEAAVRKAIRELERDVTVLVIAHRLATVRAAEYAVVLEDGIISESGTLQELLDHPEGYLSRIVHAE